MNEDIIKKNQEKSQDATVKNATGENDVPPADEIPYNALRVPCSIEERPTEDDLAQAALGGPKGNPALPPAPLTKAEQEQNLFTDEPGHVA